MFNKFRQMNQTDMADTPEWEEVEVNETTQDSEDRQIVENLYVEDEISMESDGTVRFLPGQPAYVSGAYVPNAGAIEIDGGTVDLSDFPALRMAHGTFPESERADNSSEQEKMIVSDADRLSDLIARYAEQDETEDPTAIVSESVDIQDDVPFLFRVQPIAENESIQFDDQEELQDDFTMESELEMQREISGELFEYIDTIKLNAEEIIRSRDRAYDQVNKTKVFDPYNLSFNNRYDDTEEVLSSTPEISMEPKYKLEN